ncbi:riboflavin synthase [soil metagenome]
MFTGIVSGLARIVDVRPLAADAAMSAVGPSDQHGSQLTLQAPPGYLDDVQLGDSIALNGACMTVTSFDLSNQQFTIDISAESLDKTANLTQPGTELNMEKALRANDRLGGHLVSGHVDGIGTVTHFEPVGESFELRIQAPAALMKYLAYKGSITVNGVSLTVNRVTDRQPDHPDHPLTKAQVPGAEFSINLIPHTLSNTTLGQLKAGDRVNLEVDMIARYVARMLGKES